MKKKVSYQKNFLPQEYFDAVFLCMIICRMNCVYIIPFNKRLVVHEFDPTEQAPNQTLPESRKIVRCDLQTYFSSSPFECKSLQNVGDADMDLSRVFQCSAQSGQVIAMFICLKQKNAMKKYANDCLRSDSCDARSCMHRRALRQDRLRVSPEKLCETVGNVKSMCYEEISLRLF